jgi:hypothetical protein
MHMKEGIEVKSEKKLVATLTLQLPDTLDEALQLWGETDVLKLAVAQYETRAKNEARGEYKDRVSGKVSQKALNQFFRTCTAEQFAQAQALMRADDTQGLRTLINPS